MPPTFDHGAPSDDEQLLLELINRARANPQAEAMRYSIDLNEGITSSFIAPEPRPPVAFNKFLLKSTRQHSQWMVDVDKLDHFEKAGNDPETRASAAGHTNGTAYAENLYMTSVTTPSGAAVEEIHKGLFVDSGETGRGHRRILLKDADEIGVGIVVGEYKGFTATLATEDFSTRISPDSAKYLLGVAYLYGDEQVYAPGQGIAGMEVSLSKGNQNAFTSSSGGYAIPIDTLSGELTVTFKMGPVKWKKVTVMLASGQAVKIDCPIYWWWWLLVKLLPFFLSLNLRGGAARGQ